MRALLSVARHRSWRWRATAGAAASAVIVAAALSGVAAVPSALAGSPSGLVFDGSPGTGAPPSALGPFTMQVFGADSQALGTDVGGVSGPTGEISFSPALEHLQVGNGWTTWSNGYTGDVYATGSAESATVTLPAGTDAFYLYAEPDEFETFTVTATAQDGTSSGPVSVEGESGAEYFGFYGTGGATVSSVTVTTDGDDFAIGEFGIAGTNEVAAVRFAPLSAEKSLTDYTVDTPGLPVIKDDGTAPVLDHQWAPPAGCADGLSNPQDYDYLDCTSPPSGTPSKDWPVIFTAGSSLKIDEAVFFSTTEEPGAKVSATASIGGQTLTLAPSGLTEKQADSAYELTGDGLAFTGTMPSAPGADQLTITWSITASGGSPEAVGTSTHQVYVTAGKYAAPSGDGFFGFDGLYSPDVAPYVTLLDIGTKAAAGQTSPQAVFNAIWSEFRTLNIGHPVLNPATGLTGSGTDFTYYANGYTSISSWWDVPGTPQCMTFQAFLALGSGHCGTWANFLAYVLAYQGISTTTTVLRDHVSSPSSNGFYPGPNPAPSDDVTHYAFMLVDPSLWSFGTANEPGPYQFADPLKVSGGVVSVGTGAVTYTYSSTPIAQGGISTPPEMFTTGDHEIVHTPWGYVDPSYGIPAAPVATLGAYEPSAIAGFAVVFALKDGRWEPITPGSILHDCANYTCQFRATRY
jgi:hypothetical protein